MGHVITYVGIDAQKKDLFIAMLTGYERTSTTWQVANEPAAVRRLVRKLGREASGPVARRYERASTLITTNQVITQWGTVFGDEVLAAAIRDHLLHH